LKVHRCLRRSSKGKRRRRQAASRKAECAKFRAQVRPVIRNRLQGQACRRETAAQRRQWSDSAGTGRCAGDRRAGLGGRERSPTPALPSSAAPLGKPNGGVPQSDRQPRDGSGSRMAAATVRWSEFGHVARGITVKKSSKVLPAVMF
jgi:hypothetical protein